ncbi:MAG: histidine kinase [Deltaproteobacteria bacterium]|nr:histidine kinase [Deltaproteobacteria bacterium]MBW2136062.1 histidine kinase [Deltaproteobacteria bacterium]
MLKRLSLRARLYAVLIALMCITVSGGAVTAWYTYRMERLITKLIDRNMPSLEAAIALETALVNQKGFVSYYFIDGDPSWLVQLSKYRRIFREKLAEAFDIAENGEQKQAIEMLKAQYDEYIRSKDRVIALYKAGEREKGKELHKEVRLQFFTVLDLCESYKAIQKGRIEQFRTQSRDRAERLRFAAWIAIFTVLMCGILLALILTKQVLNPVRELAHRADRERVVFETDNEVKALSRSVLGLIDDIDQTHLELQRSRESLLQAEKMALVGKLAASMAHSIRNPLTSVKMRIFSLSRTLELTGSHEEDFQVISEEIRHIDTIVQNFLEFSRPPKLKMQRISPSEVVDMVLQVLRYRFESYSVSVQIKREKPLPETLADPEQLKEAIANIIVNACESMDGGGTVTIREGEVLLGRNAKEMFIEISDTGPGIPESDQDKIFQPFFTTKDEGTGLGLSIAARIIQEHGGSITLRSRKGQGAHFIIRLP